MGIEVDLYRSDDYVRSDRIALTPLLMATFEALLGQPLTGADFQLFFLPVADRPVLAGNPVVVNLRSGHGYAQVCIIRDGVLIYRHPHPVAEIIARPLQKMLAKREPNEQHWGFDVVGLEPIHAVLVRPHPKVAMSVQLPRPSQPRMFRVEEVHAPAPPPSTLAELGVADPPPQAGDSAVRVVLTREEHRKLAEAMPLSPEVEEGGFLVGHVFADQQDRTRYIVKITAVLRAERTGASLLHFTFTGESFMRVSEIIAMRERGEELVGWYHSHLFPATDELGLSSIDINLHAGTFHRPWQLAGLINLTEDQRVVRFYAADGGRLKQVPYWVADQ